MKRNLISSAILVTFLSISFSLKAQTPRSITTKISINLADVVSISPNSNITTEPVSFQYKNESDYRQSKTIARDSYLIITATQTFDVKVRADGSNFIGEGSAAGSFIPVNVLTVEVSSNTDLPGATFSTINLSPADQNIITAAERGTEKHVTVKYIIPEAKSQSPDILGKPGGNYVQTLTYTVAAH